MKFENPKAAEPSRKVKVVMLENARGACDGKVVNLYEAGKEYEVSEGLAKCFLDCKVARCNDGKVKDEHANKMDKANYQTKGEK